MTCNILFMQALLRPGRFDRQIPVEVPVLPERKSIFELYLKKLPLEHPPEQYASRLAALTPGHTGMYKSYPAMKSYPCDEINAAVCSIDTQFNKHYIHSRLLYNICFVFCLAICNFFDSSCP